METAPEQRQMTKISVRSVVLNLGRAILLLQLRQPLSNYLRVKDTERLGEPVHLVTVLSIMLLLTVCQFQQMTITSTL